jgi:hypothetical protein
VGGQALQNDVKKKTEGRNEKPIYLIIKRFN